MPNLTDKLDLRRSDKYVALSNLSIYYTWENIKNSYKNKKFKILAPTWNYKFQLPDGLYSVQIFKIISDIFQKSMEKMLRIHQYRYMLIKLKIGLHLK